MKFSIIIPVYNVAPYIRTCLDSICAQTYDDWECVCVDDGSTDGGGTILDEYANRDVRFIIVHQANAGVSVARNVALSIITGEYYTFIDGDDAVEPDTLKCVSAYLNGGEYRGLICRPLCKTFHNDYELNELFNKGMTSGDIDVVSAPHDFFSGIHFVGGWPWGRFYKTSVFRNIKMPTDMRMAEDLVYWSDVASVPGNWIEVSVPFYAYRKRADSAVANRHSPKWYIDLITAQKYSLLAAVKVLSLDEFQHRVSARDFKCAIAFAVKGVLGKWPIMSSDQRKASDRLLQELKDVVGYLPTDVFGVLFCWARKMKAPKIIFNLISCLNRLWGSGFAARWNQVVNLVMHR